MTEPFNPDWDAMAVMVEEQQRMAKRIEELEQALAQRPWVGLTELQMYEAVRPLCRTDLIARALVEVSKDEYQAIEAALKEKNHD